MRHSEVLAAAGLLPFPADGDLRREFVVAVVAAAVLTAVLPRGRRRLATWPLLLILLTPAPFLIALLFPAEAEAFPTATLAARFLLLASLLQSVLLGVAVAAWERVGRPLPRIFLDVLRWLVSAAALLAILYEAGVKPENLFTGSAVVTAVLGFALKDTLGNVFAGLAIHAEHPFEVGDWIQYDANQAHIGRVVEINWRATKVITLDEAFVIIPNGQLAQASIRNFTKPEPWSRRSLFVITPYDVPPQRVQEIILGAIRGSFGVLAEPAPSVVTNAFTERGIEHWVRLFTTDFDKRDRVDGMARDRIWYALARHGIEIPVATHAVRIAERQVAEPATVAAERRLEAIRGVDVFSSIGVDELLLLAADAAERMYAAGEPVVRQGDAGDSMFVVLSGRVEVSAAVGGAAATRLAELGPGGFFGEMSLMTGVPRSATVTAVVETQLVEVPKRAMRRLFDAQPRLLETMGRTLRDRQAAQAAMLAGVEVVAADPQDLATRIREFFFGSGG